MWLVASPDSFTLCDDRDEAEAHKLTLEPEEQLSTQIISLY